MAPRQLGKLREITPDHESRAADVDIVLVPGIGTFPAESWPFASSSWLRSVLGSASTARVLTFEYSSTLDNSFSWEELLVQGYQLLQELASARTSSDSNEDNVRPILFVCHSFGGVILKQALCIANEQLHNYEFLVNAVAAIVFLSTPHSTPTKEGTLSHYMTVLKAATRKTVKIPDARLERENNILLGLNSRFEGIFFRTPVLSTFETVDTRATDRLFRSKIQKLVDEATCKTHAPMERVLGLDLDHRQTCHFHQSKSADATQVANFVSESLSNATELITTRIKALEFTYATMSSYSPTQSEIGLKERLLPVDSSGNATDGSSSVGFEVVPNPATIEPAKIQPRLPCVILESNIPNTNFHGREDILEHIGRELLPSKTKIVSSQTMGLRQFALCAFGGMGKTEIAQEFALRHKDDFDAIFWVQADEIAKMNQSYQLNSTTLGLEDSSSSKNHVVSRELVKGWLANPWRNPTDDQVSASPEVNWLIIFDNADDPTLLTDYWPQGSGAVLITSRDPLTKSLFSMRTAGIDLEPLTDNAGAALLQQLTNIDADTEDDAEAKAKCISQLLGGIPLAISQMAGIIRRQELSFAEFMDLYADATEHPELYQTKIGDASTIGYVHNISTVWALEKLKPESLKLLELMAFMDPDNIHEDLLLEASVELLPKDVPFKNSLYRDLRTELLQSSLVRRNKQKNELSMHRLLQDAVRAKMEPEASKAMFETAVQLLWVNWPSAMPRMSKTEELVQPKSVDGRNKVSRWPLCASLYPHVLRLHHLFPFMPEVSPLGRMAFAAVLNDAGFYQNERGITHGFDNFFDTAVSICEPLDHPDRDGLLSNIYHVLGTIHYVNNDAAGSRGYIEKSLELQLKIFKKHNIVDDRLAMAYAERGLRRFEDGQFDEGIADYMKDREIRQKLGTYAPTSKEANIASAHMVKGDLDSAEKELMEAISKRAELYGEDDKESFRAGYLIHALGRLRDRQGRHDEGFQCHQRALANYRVTIGDQHPYAALVKHKLAEHLIRLHRNEEAMDIINDALKIWSIDAEVSKPELARATFLKSQLLYVMKKEQKAAVALKVAARLRQELTKEKKVPSSLKAEDFAMLVPFWKG